MNGGFAPLAIIAVDLALHAAFFGVYVVHDLGLYDGQRFLMKNMPRGPLLDPLLDLRGIPAGIDPDIHNLQPKALTCWLQPAGFK